jgi:hypothetical protein
MPGFAGGGAAEAAGLVAAGLPVAGPVAVGDSSVAGTEAPGLGAKPGAPGADPTGFTVAAGLVVVGKVDAGLPVAGTAGVISGGAGGVATGGGGVWPSEVSASAKEQRQVVSSVFIVGLIYRLEFR